MRSNTAITKLINWVTHDALPYWAENGIDPNGGAWEKLALDGAPVKHATRRVRVQARQTYVYAHAHVLGWFPNAKEISDHIWHYLTTKGFQGGAYGCAHLLNADGTIQDPLRDTYAQAFLMLAASWRWRAFNDLYAKDILYQTTDFLNNQLKSPSAGWLESDEHKLPRRQNPHMHMLESFLAAFEATEDSAFLALADDVFELFVTSFYDKNTHGLIEFFEEDWSPHSETGHLTEPGHMLEWCWLLNTYHRIADRDVSQYSEPLYDRAIKIGTAEETGLICNKTDISGCPEDSNARLWPQTEYVKANISRHENGHPDAHDKIEKMIELIFKHYLTNTPKGGWHDERSSTGELLSNSMPSSTFYHIFCMAAEVNRAL